MMKSDFFSGLFLSSRVLNSMFTSVLWTTRQNHSFCMLGLGFVASSLYLPYTCSPAFPCSIVACFNLFISWVEQSITHNTTVEFSHLYSRGDGSIANSIQCRVKMYVVYFLLLLDAIFQFTVQLNYICIQISHSWLKQLMALHVQVHNFKCRCAGRKQKQPSSRHYHFQYCSTPYNYMGGVSGVSTTMKVLLFCA